jgi:hypothetical protein
MTKRLLPEPLRSQYLVIVRQINQLMYAGEITHDQRNERVAKTQEEFWQTAAEDAAFAAQQREARARIAEVRREYKAKRAAANVEFQTLIETLRKEEEAKIDEIDNSLA